MFRERERERYDDEDEKVNLDENDIDE